ncbi:hypothetical protein [Rariglobus hedericola]|uniref:Tetratricopeptide repeat protein n=1 Tax=Rariglobus hedericola TaxID=2597822 RepID=A0A556QPD0_9BACT|nr:hypothetical protein [Rariglobus hedericola]TSJ78503.1 hypothetical protein FPL22_04165 [Rariglobus hedericola]
MGWITDFFRLAWGLLYWNARKTVYRRRLKHGRGRCPCQHPSDSGRAFETGCAAMIHWNEPARFRRVCPLLQQTEAGPWRCSVNRTDVRPFWGRAGVFYGTAFVTCYLVAGLSAFIFMRSVGYQVTYAGVLWPPAWSKFTPIRTEFFLQKYQAGVASGDMQSAVLALSTAYNLDPTNYAAGRQLAHFWQVPQPSLSNQVYSRLLHEHPEEAEATAQVWFLALLARGDFPAIEALAVERIIAAPDQSGAWLNAFLFANRRTGNAAAREQIATTAGMPSTVTFLLTLSKDLQKNKPDQARARLLTAAAGAGDALSFFQVCRQLIDRGFAQEALQWIDKRSSLLGPRDLIALRLDAIATLRWGTTLRSEVETLLVTKPEPVIMELLSAHLIRYPDAAVRDVVFARLERDPLPIEATSYSAYLSLFCAAGVGRDETHLRWVSARIKQIVRTDFRSLDLIGDTLMNASSNRRVENYLQALQPLPLEVSYALFDHYAPVP